ncbi:transposase [Erwinia tracheiphila PSU-1]|nr:transposase [Erwinia tracheiphila PSU-1]
MTDASGLPLSRVVAAANTHDIRLVADTPDALQTGRQVQKPGLCPGNGDEAVWLKT